MTNIPFPLKTLHDYKAENEKLKAKLEALTTACETFKDAVNVQIVDVAEGPNVDAGYQECVYSIQDFTKFVKALDEAKEVKDE